MKNKKALALALVGVFALAASAPDLTLRYRRLRYIICIGVIGDGMGPSESVMRMMEVTAAVIRQGDKFLICQRLRDKYCGLLCWRGLPDGAMKIR